MLANATKAEHLEMLESVQDQFPVGDCDICQKKDVKVFPMTHVDEPARQMNVCFGCMSGEGTEMVEMPRPELN